MDSEHEPHQIEAALQRRRAEGLSFAELSTETGIPVGLLAHHCYGLPARGAEDAFTELVLTGDAEPTDDRVVLHGPLGHRLEVSAHLPPQQVAALLRTLPC